MPKNHPLLIHLPHVKYEIMFKIPTTITKDRVCLPSKFKHKITHFKQYYIYFYTLFHSSIYQKHSNNITQTNLPIRHLYLNQLNVVVDLTLKVILFENCTLKLLINFVNFFIHNTLI